MGEYFKIMFDVIKKQGGIIDKFIGDAIMAFWGAPLPDADEWADVSNKLQYLTR